ncbi:hypothetical protein D3C78_1512190 [compost metagenome]
MQTRPRSLAGDAQNGNGIGRGGVKRGDHVRSRRPRSPETHPDIAGFGPGVTFRHVGSAFNMTRQIVFDAAVLTHRVIERVDRRARHAECGIHAFLCQHVHCRIYCSHNSHLNVLLNFGKIFQT